jgi:hypothetical protein
MQWNDQWNSIPPVVWLGVAFGALMVLLVITQSRRSKALGQRLELVARELGWSEVKRSNFFVLAVSGLWNGYPVKVRRIPRQKSIPERVVTTMRVQAPARIDIRRRQRGFLSGRPIAMFGPPLIELPLAQQFWIRSDEITLAERLMMSSAAPMLDRTLFTRFDLFKMRNDQILIQRASEHDPDGVARIAREELELAKAVVDALALRP